MITGVGVEGYLLTVVTITFNNYIELKETLESVNDCLDIKLLVINGGLCPKTLDFLANCNCCSVSEPDCGISDAFSKGAALSNTPYITFLNSGDLILTKNYYNTAIQKLEQHPEYDFVYSDYYFKDSSAGLIHIPAARCSLGRGMPFPHPTMIVRRSVFDRIGYFSLDFKVAMDFDFVVRMMKAQMKGYYIPEPTILMDGTGVSSNQELKGILESGRSLRQNGMMTLENTFFYYLRFFLWGVRYLIKRFVGEKALAFFKKLKYRKSPSPNSSN